jgi:hypothetical protein
METTDEITIWDPPDHFGRKALSLPFPAELTMDFESLENGTQLTLTWQGEIRDLFKIAEVLLGRQIEKGIDNDLSALKFVMEEGQA